MQFVADLPPALRSPLLRAGAARFAAQLAWRRRDPKTAEERLTYAAQELRDIRARFNLAQVLLELAEILAACDRDEEAQPLLAEGRAIFEELHALPWLERADAFGTRVPA